MTDLTAITTPFGLLDRETQEALRAHGGPYEYWNGGSWTNSASETLHDIDTALTYRVKPAPPKPRTIYLVECAPCGPAMVCQTAIEATKVALIHSGAKISEWAEVITE